MVHPKLALVLEHADQGDLYGALTAPSVRLSTLDRLHLALDVCRGLRHLHSHHLVHRDVKSANVLLTLMPVPGSTRVRLSAKVGDFGASKNLEVDGVAFTELGTAGRTAPEVLGAHDDTEAGYGMPADVFSLGVLLWELFAPDPRANPFVGMPAVKYCRELERGKRLELPDTVHGDYRAVVSACWSWMPADRPSVAHVCGVLEHIIAGSTWD